MLEIVVDAFWIDDDDMDGEEHAELRELQDSETWDWDQVEAIGPAERPGAVVPVRFSVAEFERVSDAAERAGGSLQEFIRQIVLAALAAPAEK
jgi:hypothetical protein